MTFGGGVEYKQDEQMLAVLSKSGIFFLIAWRATGRLENYT